jgi:nicotinate-nucleotide adenylyltransferase
MRLGIFGGSFDPVHLGHLLLAETCREQCRLDQVWFLPTAVAPHKQGQPTAPAKDRLTMLELALAGHSALVVSALEIDRGGVSYTVETLEEVQRQEPDAELFLLMGADSLADLPTWHRTDAICRLALPVVVRRPGSPEPDFEVLAGLVTGPRREEIRGNQVESPLIDISSSDIRERIASGRSIRYRVPRAVEKYIETNGLYRPAAAGESQGRTTPPTKTR